ncbi:MAG TPA: hypothetical protein PLI90_09210 [Rhodocyclaceae bacterium]|jgi:hypothetical protein|nr:hypothetical protein [Rhodocyclaceae bacterium]
MNDQKKFPTVIGLLFFFGIFLCIATFLIPPESPDYSGRWLTFMVGFMMILMGLLQLKSLWQALSPELAGALKWLALIIVFGTFASVFLIGGLFYGDEISGNIPFVSAETNNRVGRFLFIAFGGLLGVFVLTQMIGLVIYLIRWAQGKL